MSDDDAFLAGIAAAPADPLPRLVYADWLDDRTDPRAEVVRLEVALAANPSDDAALKRFRDLASGCDPRWLATVVRPAVARCGIRFDFACPKKWDDLQPTAEPAVRRCGECEQPVYLCSDRVDARRQARRGRCVAVDARLVDPADLRPDPQPEPVMMGDIEGLDDGPAMGMVDVPSPGFWEQLRETVADYFPRWRR